MSTATLRTKIYLKDKIDYHAEHHQRRLLQPSSRRLARLCSLGGRGDAHWQVLPSRPDGEMFICDCDAIRKLERESECYTWNCKALPCSQGGEQFC